MQKKILRLAVGLLFASALFSVTACAQDDDPDWRMTGANAGQSGSKKGESAFTPENISANFKLLWKLKLGQPSNGARSFSEPLLAARLINGQGFKDLVYWSSADTLFAVDYELGALVWKKQYDMSAVKTASGCEVSSLSVTMEPPLVINFRARRQRPPGTPRPPDPPPAKASERKLGVAPGGGYFGFKGIYVLTPDGMLHEQVITTGADFAPPVKFLPAPGASAYGLNFADRTIYSSTGRDCSGVPNGAWAIDFAAGDYQVKSYDTEKLHPLSLTGPVITPQGNSLLVTGTGTSDATAGVYASSVVSLSKDMKVQDWYTPKGGMASYESVSPVTFTYKDKQFVIAPGKDGGLTLLDAASLGGADHQTPLFETAPFAKTGEKHGWDGFATWEDKDGTLWVFASVSTGITLSDGGLKPTTHGGVVAFKADDANGKVTLNPVWVSGDMINPAPPRVVNGIAIALAGGDSSTHAQLHILNAATGAELYSSKDEIPAYTQLSGVSVGDSHVFFTDHDNVLYSFGIALEH
ncbi:MAG TPA: hypothetical protein VH088_16705 [Terriglobales bacterium]|nr:hypothetical protein [Terriglobales bacterium]